MLNCKKSIAYRAKLTSDLNSAHSHYARTSVGINATKNLFPSVIDVAILGKRLGTPEGIS
jgi:hypothetical protein